jgi:hypothetical protein
MTGSRCPLHREIRVLDLLPGNQGDDIKCSIRILQLDGDEGYEALSYVWGQRGDEKEIAIMDQRISVTENLYTALQRLRQPVHKRTMWIDQLCINQLDNLERSSQVAMMRDIYRRCSSCIIWLGELGDIPNESAADVFSFIKEIAAVSTTPYVRLPTLFRDNLAGEAARIAFAAFAMYGNPWWSRIWTVQEAIIPLQAVFIWGHLLISRDDVLATSRHLRSELLHAHFPESFRTKRRQHHELLRRMLYPVHGFIHSSTNDGPLDLLMRWRHRDATDSRDKVYALMGLLPDNVLPSARTYDYDAPAATLFANVTFDLIQEEGGLRPFIGSCELPHQTANLPSWAIDFAACNRLGQRQLHWWGHSHRYRQFCASGSKILQASLDHDGKVLCLTGSFLDEVEVVGRIYHVPDGQPIMPRKVYSTIMDWDNICQDWRVFHGVSPLTYPSNESWRESWDAAFARTIVGDLVMEEYPIERTTYADLDHRRALQDALYSEQSHTCLTSVRGMVPNQAFFVTKNGWMGIGPKSTREGDEIWTLHGGQVPFILRGAEGLDRKTLVGDAYVHGIMDGEIKWLGRKEETVRLC